VFQRHGWCFTFHRSGAADNLGNCQRLHVQVMLLLLLHSACASPANEAAGRYQHRIVC
jgi:hypothetical protein